MNEAPTEKAAAEGVMELEGQIGLLEERLKDAMEEREMTQAVIKKQQSELEHLFARSPKRPRERMFGLDEKIAMLERERTSTSIPLNKEKEILSQIYRLEKAKRQVEEYEAHERQIKATKVHVAKLREWLKTLNNSISRLRAELSTLKTAGKLGCNIEELLGMKLDCPRDKLAQVMGKKGGRMKELMEKANVTVDVVPKTGDVRIHGRLDSLDTAALNVSKAIATEKVAFDVPADLVDYFTSKHIRALLEIRERHPDVYFDVVRNNTQVKARGLPDDIESLKEDLLSFAIVKKHLRIPKKECSIVVGKQGKTVEKLVLIHQAAIEVDKKEEEESVVTVLGPLANVEAATHGIEEILAAQREGEETVPVDAHAKSALLMNGGAGIHDIFKKVNDATRETGPGVVHINFTDHGIIIRGRTAALPIAKAVVDKHVRQLESSIVRISLDPFVAPKIVGKNGSGIKKIRGENKTVDVEIDRAGGEAVICGANQAEVEAVKDAITEFISANQVGRINVDAAMFKTHFRDLLRSQTARELNDLVYFTADDDKSQILLRGTAENVEKAETLVREFIATNFKEEIDVSVEDRNALLRGGKESKIASLSEELGVSLASDRSHNIIVVKGEESKVKAAVQAVNNFLYGGDGIAATKITLDEKLLGLVIGKGGKNLADLESKYKAVEIVFHRKNKRKDITLRGPEADVEACRVEIMKIIFTARITRTVNITAKQSKDLKKSGLTRRISQESSVQVSQSDSAITVRGCRDAAEYAVALINEKIHGVYESRVELESARFQKVRDACRQSQHFQLIQRASGADVSLDSATESILIKGKHHNVKSAKLQLFNLLDFILGSSLARIDILAPMLPTVGDASSLAEVSAISGASVRLDHDTQSILVFSSDSSEVEKAAELLNAKIKEHEKSIFILQLEPREDWLVSAIKGKNGKQIKSLRKDTNCRIDVDPKQHRVVISADDSELVAKARNTLEKVIAEAMKGCAFVDISDRDTPAFIGRSGAGVKEFEDKHGVDIQIMKKSPTKVRLEGKEEAVRSAKAALDEWLASRRAVREQEQATETVPLRIDQVPVIIGTRGSTIRALEKEFGCKLDIDRVDPSVTVRGGSPEKRQATIAKIQTLIANEHSEDCETIPLRNDQVPAVIGTRGATILALEKEFGCKLDMDRVEPSVTVRGGTPEKRQAAIAKIQALIATEHSEGTETIPLRNDQVPAVIGTRGATILALEKEFGCKLDVDRGDPSVTVRGGSPEKRQAAIEKIQTIISNEPTEVSTESSSEQAKRGSENSPKPVRKAVSPKPEPKIERTPVKQKVEQPAPRALDFPALISMSLKSEETSVTDSISAPSEKDIRPEVNPSPNRVVDINSPSWAAILTAPKQPGPSSRPPQDARHSEGPIPTAEINTPTEEETRRFVKMISEVAWDANSVDSDDLPNDL